MKGDTQNCLVGCLSPARLPPSDRGQHCETGHTPCCRRGNGQRANSFTHWAREHFRTWGSDSITLGKDCVFCSGSLLFWLSASPHQAPEPKPGLLPRPQQSPSARGGGGGGGFAAKAHISLDPAPKWEGWSAALGVQTYPPLPKSASG